MFENEAIADSLSSVAKSLHEIAIEVKKLKERQFQIIGYLNYRDADTKNHNLSFADWKRMTLQE